MLENQAQRQGYIIEISVELDLEDVMENNKRWLPIPTQPRYATAGFGEE